jgi:CheY-like chemotaxis protein
MKILLVEDDNNRIDWFKATFKDEYELDITDKVEEAIELLKTEKYQYIFLDHDLRGVVYDTHTDTTGYAVALWMSRNLDAKWNTEKPPVVVHSMNPCGALAMYQCLINVGIVTSKMPFHELISQYSKFPCFK